MNIYRVGSPLALCQRSLELSPLESNLIRLAFDSAASEGEIRNCSVALVRSLRKRYRSGHALLQDIETPPQPAVPAPENIYGRTILTFGKYRGKRLRDVPPEYLLWVLANCHRISPHLRAAIRTYLG
jgi:Putative quorum-sensing-regulated virulence factor